MIDRDTTYGIYKNSTPKQKYFFSSKKSDDLLFTIAQKYDLDKDEEKNKLFNITVGDIILGFYKIEDTVPLLQQELGLDPRTAALLGADVLDFLAPLSDPNWQPPAEEVEEDEEDIDAENEQTDLEENDRFQETSDTPEPASVPTAVTNNQPHKIPYAQSAEGTFREETPTETSPQTYQPVQAPAFPENQPTTLTPAEDLPAPNPALHTMANDMEHVRQTGEPSPRATPSLNLEHAPTYVSQNQDSLRQPLSDTPSYTPPPRPLNPSPVSDIEPPRWSDD